MASKPKQLVICIRNQGFAASLERRKLYVALTDIEAERHGLMRVVDESGEDYLYPQQLFVAVELPNSLRRRVLRAA